MIERFYDPLIGRVTLDGIDIKDLNVGSYRSNVSLVSQEPTLYAGTVRFNVLLGASKSMDQVTEEEVVQACKDANIVCPLFYMSRHMLIGSTISLCPFLMGLILKSEEKDLNYQVVK